MNPDTDDPRELCTGCKQHYGPEELATILYDNTSHRWCEDCEFLATVQQCTGCGHLTPAASITEVFDGSVCPTCATGQDGTEGIA